jgi:hypothetical protein
MLDNTRIWRDEASDLLAKAKGYSQKDKRLPTLTFNKENWAKTVSQVEDNACVIQKMIDLVARC